MIVIILFAILIWWLTGFLPGRPIKPKLNRWHTWGPFGQVWGFIDGDRKSLIPYSMPWPFRKQFFMLNFNQFADISDKTDEYTGISREGKTIVYKKAIVHPGLKGPVRQVEEEVTRIRKLETHPYIVKINLPKTGVTFYLCFTLKARVVNPMLTQKLDNFLIYLGNELNDAVYPWGKKREEQLLAKILGSKKAAANVKTIEGPVANRIIDEMIGLAVDNTKSIIIDGEPLMQNLNNKIAKYGLELIEPSLDVGFDEKVQKLLDKRNDQAQEAEQALLEEKKSATRSVIRDREVADRVADRQQNVLDLNNHEKPLLKAIGESQAQANRAYEAETLVIGADASNQTAVLTKALLEKKKKIGGNYGNSANPTS